MSTFSGGILSGSTNGRPIVVAATTMSPGTTIHQAPALGFDEITLFVTNTDTSPRRITVGFGGNTSGDLAVPNMSIPAQSGPIPLLTLRLAGNLSITACSDSANVTLITGYYNRETP